MTTASFSKVVQKQRAVHDIEAAGAEIGRRKASPTTLGAGARTKMMQLVVEGRTSTSGYAFWITTAESPVPRRHRATVNSPAGRSCV